MTDEPPSGGIVGGPNGQDTTASSSSRSSANNSGSKKGNNNKTASVLLPRELWLARSGSSAEQQHTIDEQQKHRAVHRIRLSALEHNYRCVESSANKQRCSVIAVVKADGYGHGAVAAALHLADVCGADAFAVATLEEAIHLRRAFENNPPGRWSKQLASHFHVTDSSHPASWAVVDRPSTSSSSGGVRHGEPSPTSVAAARSTRRARIRILVLGPPVGFPRCFDDYYYHNIEVMVSGPEVAVALLAWVADEKERKRTQVERAANETMARALYKPMGPRENNVKGANGVHKPIANAKDTPLSSIAADVPLKALRHPSSTLGNVSGHDLAKEVRTLLMNQKAAKDASNLEKELQEQQQQGTSKSTSVTSSDNSIESDSSAGKPQQPVPTKPPTQAVGTTFAGIEALAKDSRAREIAVNRQQVVQEEHSPTIETTTSAATTASTTMIPQVDHNKQAARKRLRWHALVDSGMGRLGFKSEVLPKQEQRNGNSSQNTVAIIQELVDAEIHTNAPIEFFGMCTHMADASSSSTYTNSQIERFTSLLSAVRQAGISVP